MSVRPGRSIFRRQAAVVRSAQQNQFAPPGMTLTDPKTLRVTTQNRRGRRALSVSQRPLSGFVSEGVARTPEGRHHASHTHTGISCVEGHRPGKAWRMNIETTGPSDGEVGRAIERQLLGDLASGVALEGAS